MPNAQFSTRQSSASNALDNLGPLDYQATTASDTVDLPITPGQCVVGIVATGAGAVSVQLFNGQTAIYTLLAGGAALGNVKRVLATGTTATGLGYLTLPL